jgi:predicted dehydrogenase
MAKKYRIAVIGCGGIARAHAGAWREAGADNGEIAACADISQESLDKYTAQFGIKKGYLDYVEMLEKERPDIVHVCTYHPLHAPMVINAAEYKPKAIVCEKPIALSLGDADAMINACEKNGVRFVVTHQRRMEANNVLAKQAIKRGDIGELNAVYCGLHPWSTLLIDGTHLLDLVFFYMDDAPAKYVFGNVFCKSGKMGWGNKNEDASFGVVHFANRKSAHFSTGGFENPEDTSSDAYYGLRPGVTGPIYYSMTLMGSKGFIEIQGDIRDASPDTMLARIVNAEGEKSLLTLGERKDSREAWGFSGVMKALLRSLETGEPHPLEGKLARHPLEVITAMALSAKERRCVYLPLDISKNPLFDLIDEDSAARSNK